MFTGLFSGILPYLIAGGFYLLYFLFSLVQPLAQKAFSRIQNEDNQNLVVNEDKPAPETENCFNFDNYDEDSDTFLHLSDKSCLSFPPPDNDPFPPEAPAAGISFCLLPSHFCRPPPIV